MKRLRTLLVLSMATGMAICQADEAWVGFTEDGRKIQAKAESVPEIESGFSAAYELEGKGARIKSDSPMGPAQETIAQTPFGEAVVSSVTYGKKDSPFQNEPSKPSKPPKPPRSCFDWLS